MQFSVLKIYCAQREKLCWATILVRFHVGCDPTSTLSHRAHTQVISQLPNVSAT